MPRIPGNRLGYFCVAASEYTQSYWGLSVMGAETAGDIPDDGWDFITTGHMRDSVASAYTPYPDLFDRMDEESF